MSSITSVQDLQEVNNVNPTQDLQKSTSLHGRAFHKITEGGKYIIQSINNIAQSVLSTCIRVVSFGRYNLDSLKSYLFSTQTALKGDKTTIPSNSSLRSAPPLPPPNAPPPPRMPTQEDLNRASSSRFSSAKVQSSPFQEPITLRARSADVGSSFNPTQDSPEEDDNILEDGIHSGLTSGSSLGENVNRLSGQGNAELKHEEVKAKKPKPGFMSITQDIIASARKGLKKPKNKVTQE